MEAEDLIAAFDTLAEAPDGVARLRDLVLQLAVRGRLVPQDPEDEPAKVEVARSRERIEQLVERKEVPKPKTAQTIHEESTPHEIPANWCWAPLGHVVVVLDFMREPVKKSDRAARIRGKRPDELYPYYGATQQAGWIDDYIFDEELLLLGEDGAPFLDAVKNVAYVVSGKYWVNNHAHVLRGIAVFNRYLCHVLNQTDFAEFVTGTTRLKLTQGKMVRIPIPVPSAAEQHRIVARVDELMDLIDRLEAARNARETTRVAFRDAALTTLQEADTPEELKEAWTRVADRMDDLLTDPADIEPMRQAVLQLAVRGRLMAQDPEDEPADVLLERIATETACGDAADDGSRLEKVSSLGQDDSPFRIPAGWEWTRLESVLVDDLRNGWSPKAVEFETSVRTLKLSATTKGVFDPREFKFVDAEVPPGSPMWLCPGDLLIQRSNTPEYVGMAAIYDGDEQEFIFPDLMMRCRVSSRVEVSYVHKALIAPFNRSYFASKASGTSQSMVKVNQATVRRAPLPLPPAAEQHRIVARVDELMDLLDRLEARLGGQQATCEAFAKAVVHSVANLAA